MLKICIAAGLVMCSSASIAGERTVLLHTFDAGPQIDQHDDHKQAKIQGRRVALIDLVDPGEGGSAVAASDSRATLAEAFQALPRERQVTMPRGQYGPGGVRVPTWMKSSPRIAPQTSGGFFTRGFRREGGFSATPMITSGCYVPPYKPKGLKAEVEMRRARYYPTMAAVACEQGVPVMLFDSLLTQESGYNPAALSPKGAMGISQLMPGTADLAGVSNPWDPVQNMRGGASVLKSHLDEFGRYDLALAAYNAGPGRVRAKGGVPRIAETVDYVRAILSDVRRQFDRQSPYLER